MFLSVCKSRHDNMAVPESVRATHLSPFSTQSTGIYSNADKSNRIIHHSETQRKQGYTTESYQETNSDYRTYVGIYTRDEYRNVHRLWLYLNRLPWVIRSLSSFIALQMHAIELFSRIRIYHKETSSNDRTYLCKRTCI